MPRIAAPTASVAGVVQMEQQPDLMGSEVGVTTMVPPPDQTVLVVPAIVTEPLPVQTGLVAIVIAMAQPHALMVSAAGEIATELIVALMGLVVFVATKSPNNSFERDAPQAARPSS